MSRNTSPKQTLINQAKKGKTANVTYNSKKDKAVILRNVGAVGIRGGRLYVQDQTNPTAPVKSLIISRILAAEGSEETFEDDGFSEFKETDNAGKGSDTNGESNKRKRRKAKVRKKNTPTN